MLLTVFLKAKSNEEDLKRIEKDRLDINAAYDNVSAIDCGALLTSCSF